MYYFCTYFDKNYLAQGLVLRDSLNKHLPNDFILYVLSLDEYVYNFFQKNHFEGVQVILLEAIEQKYPELLNVKFHRKIYEYYFTITPTLPWYILETYQEVDMITYLDADIYFFQSPKILFNELGDNSILLIPHFFSEKNKEQEIHGKYNVVFNTFKRDENGLKCLNWWREKCIEWCFDYVEGDKFADQKYLDKFPLLFEGVKVSENKGANLAIFNLDNSVITKEKDVFKVNGFPLVFYHFHRLREERKYLYNPHYLDEKASENKYILEIYLKYIGLMQKYEKKYGLTNNTKRYQSKALKGREMIDKLIHNTLILYHPFYKGAVSLQKLYYMYKKSKIHGLYHQLKNLYR